MPTWGLRPSWAKEKGPRPINARLETAATNGMFRSAFASARALVPMTGYYEWQEALEDGKKVKNPSYVHAPGDEQGRRRAQEAFAAILQLAIDCGGTITGEHGVGRTKASALPDQLGEDVMELGQRVRAALDPLGILNPGVLW